MNVRFYIQISFLFNKDSSHLVLEPTYLILTPSVKTLFPNEITFLGTGGYVFSISFCEDPV